MEYFPNLQTLYLYDRDDEQYENALLWKNDLEEAEWTVNVPASGLYGLTVCWKAADDSTENIIRSIKIDGKSPFSECESIKFNRLWVDDIKDDAKELLVRPRVKQLFSWRRFIVSLIVLSFVMNSAWSSLK